MTNQEILNNFLLDNINYITYEYDFAGINLHDKETNKYLYAISIDVEENKITVHENETNNMIYECEVESKLLEVLLNKIQNQMEELKFKFLYNIQNKKFSYNKKEEY